MRTVILLLISITLLGAVTLTGCASRGSEFLGKWVNTKNPNDTFQITRNGNGYLIVAPEPGTFSVGAANSTGRMQPMNAL